MTAVIKLHKNIYTGERRTWFCDGPFTNEYKFPFVIDDNLYLSVSHYLLTILNKNRVASGKPELDSLPEYLDNDMLDHYMKATYEKFMQNILLKKMILLTCSREITFACMRDETMYISLGRNPPTAPEKPGQFHVNTKLGKVLMDTRQIIKKKVIESFPLEDD